MEEDGFIRGKGIEKLLGTKCGKGKDQYAVGEMWGMLHLVYPVLFKLLKEERIEPWASTWDGGNANL